MQEILDIYSELYQATRGKIQGEKTFSFCWRQRWKNGKREAEDILIKVKIDDKILEQKPIIKQVRTLGVHLSPSIKWNTQFMVMIEKIISAVSKLKQMTINPHLTYLAFNIYMMKSVYFGCGIVELSLT